MPALFYHVTQSALETVAETLLSRALGQGWWVELRGVTPDRMAWFDEKLWLGAEESFLPHGLAGGLHDDLQPVLLTTAPCMPGRQALMTVEGAEVAPDEVARLERVWVLFDGRDEAALHRAREQWKALTAAGASAQYWSEQAGKWEKKAER